MRDRLNGLVKVMQKTDEKKDEEWQSSSFDFDEVEDLSEEERWKEEAIWETLSVAENRAELEREIRIIKDLISEAQNVIHKESEVKLQQLKDTMYKLQVRFPEDDTKDKKILIFTEAKDTLDYLEKRVRSWGYSVNTIHGGMKLQDRIRAESVFRNETQIMLATEGAGEVETTQSIK